MLKMSCLLGLRRMGHGMSRPASLRMVILVTLVGCSTACSSSSGSTSRRNDDAGKWCQITDTENQCPTNASLCYGVGISSSCSGGALCVGDGKRLTCAYYCSQDADCALDGSATVCTQGCQATIVNGYCVQASVRSDILRMTCSTGSSGDLGSSGVSY